MNHIVYSPYGSGFTALLVLFLLIAIGMLFFGVLTSAFEHLGLRGGQAGLVLIAALIGSGINIPIGQVHSNVPIASSRLVRLHGLLYRIPSHSLVNQDTTIAVNVGGAVIPLLVCTYLILRFPRALPFGVLATVPVTLIVHAYAQLVPGLGVAIPSYLPSLAAAATSIILCTLLRGDRRDLFVAAYMGGTLGTLIGADLLNLGRIGSLGAPIASIGGAGTFDGVFLTGLLAVLLVMIPAGFFRRAPDDAPAASYD